MLCSVSHGHVVQTISTRAHPSMAMTFCVSIVLDVSRIGSHLFWSGTIHANKTFCLAPPPPPRPDGTLFFVAVGSGARMPRAAVSQPHETVLPMIFWILTPVPSRTWVPLF